MRSVGLAEREMRFHAVQAAASLRLPPLVLRTRGRHFHRPTCAETAHSAVELVPLARGELPRARPRYWFWRPPTLPHSRLAARRCKRCRVCRALAGLTGTSRPPEPPFQAPNAAPCFFRATFPTASLTTACAKTDSTTGRAGDARLALSFNGCPTSACSRQAPSPRLRRSSGPCC